MKNKALKTMQIIKMFLQCYLLTSDKKYIEDSQYLKWIQLHSAHFNTTIA